MKNTLYIHQRALESAKYLISNKSTIRETALHMGYSKSAVHKDLTKILPEISHKLYNQAKQILHSNYTEKHVRGGAATRIKWIKEKDMCVG